MCKGSLKGWNDKEIPLFFRRQKNDAEMKFIVFRYCVSLGVCVTLQP